MHFSRKTQIAHLKGDEVFSKMPSKYINFADVFSPKLAIKLSEHIRINDHAIIKGDNVYNKRLAVAFWDVQHD